MNRLSHSMRPTHCLNPRCGVRLTAAPVEVWNRIERVWVGRIACAACDSTSGYLRNPSKDDAQPSLFAVAEGA